MPDVTFKFNAPLCVIGVTIQNRANPAIVTATNFQNAGTKKVPLQKGDYDVGYRVVGTPLTAFDVEVTAGGTMNAVHRSLSPDGRAGGVRTLTVP